MEEKLPDFCINAHNMNNIMVYNIHNICDRKWHIMLARVRIN